MSTVSNSSLLDLPPELLYRILDRLDIKDILFSFRNVCTYFHTIVNNHNRFKIRFTSTTSIADIHRICRIIQPENVISCIISRTRDASENIADDRIRLFLSLIDARRFTRLRSLDLFDADTQDVNAILPHISNSPLFISLKWINSTTASQRAHDLLSSIIVTSYLRKLHLHYISPQVFTKIPIPNQCKLQELTVDNCTHRELCNILGCLPNLRAFSSMTYTMEEMDPIDFSTSFQQLTSLSLKSPYMLIDQLESLLSVTPSLVDLQIINYSATFRFLQRLTQWERFIPHKLPQLQNLRFYTSMDNYDYRKVSDIEVILDAFRTPFWLDHKCWYVTCKYIKNEARSGMMLYSSIDTTADFPDNLEPDILSYTTSTTKNDVRTPANSTWNARLNLSEMEEISSDKTQQPTERIFRHVNQLALDIDWTINSFDLLSTLFDLSQLTKITLFLLDCHDLDSQGLSNLLNLTCNVRTLHISYADDSATINREICSVISRQIEHLEVRTMDLKFMKRILTYVQRLSSVTFINDRASSNSWTNIIEWLSGKGLTFSQSRNHKSFRVCLNTTTDELERITTVQ